MDTTKGAYIYKDQDNNTILFIYMKLTPQELKKSLPMSNPLELSKSYLIASFIDGQDYIGSINKPELELHIKQNKMINIITNTTNTNSNIPKEQYNSLRQFAISQLKL